MTTESLSLSVRRTIKASQRRVFEAWTEPQHLCRWWGPPGISCPHAEVDLRVGGAYRIGNQLPAGTVIWIRGEFEAVSRHDQLVYTWTTAPVGAATERVTVNFVPLGDAVTEVVVFHEQIPDQDTVDQHLAGWVGCLDGLEQMVDAQK